jgi:WD40 repeat protein
MSSFLLRATSWLPHRKTKPCDFGFQARECLRLFTIHVHKYPTYQATLLILFMVFRKGESVTMKGHTGPVRSVNFSQDSKYLVTASDDKTAKVGNRSYG